MTPSNTLLALVSNNVLYPGFIPGYQKWQKGNLSSKHERPENEHLAIRVGVDSGCRRPLLASGAHSPVPVLLKPKWLGNATSASRLLSQPEAQNRRARHGCLSPGLRDTASPAPARAVPAPARLSSLGEVWRPGTAGRARLPRELGGAARTGRRTGAPRARRQRCGVWVCVAGTLAFRCVPSVFSSGSIRPLAVQQFT